MTEPVLAGQKLAVLKAVGATRALGKTAWEISSPRWFRGTPAQQSVVASRLSQLHRLRLVEDSGWRRRGSSGRLLIVWAITEKGREALRRAEEVSR